jgi:hypothetical protein
MRGELKFTDYKKYTNIKIVLTGVEGEGVSWIRLEMGIVEWRAFVNMAIKI